MEAQYGLRKIINIILFSVNPVSLPKSRPRFFRFTGIHIRSRQSQSIAVSFEMKSKDGE